MKIVIIGDIHGCYAEFLELLDKIKLSDGDLLISLGDIVDRGPQSKELYEYFITRPNSIVLMGNHERKHLNGTLSYAQDIVKLQFGEHYEEFVQWTKTLPYYVETPEALIVHAAFENGISIDEQREDVLSGTNSGDRYLQTKYEEGTYWSDHYSGEKPVIYGHHVVGDTPKYLNNTIGIDTGACHGGFLTAVELPGFVIHQVKVEHDYWKEQQQLWQIPVLKAKPWTTMEFAAITRQLDKLSYIENQEVRAILGEIRSWTAELDTLLQTFPERLQQFAAALKEQHGEQFNRVASRYEFKTFLFQAMSGKLTVDELSRKLETPEKRLRLAQELGIETGPYLINF
jgi:serine/threonine protein phosphatase 1